MKEGIIHAAEGALGGVLGTIFIQQELAAAQKLPAPAKPVQPKQDPGQFMAERAERLARRPVSQKTLATAAKGRHVAYGTGWGTLLGLFASPLGMSRLPRAIAAGAGMGAAVWAVGYLGWLPAAGLTPPVHLLWRQGAGHVATSLAAHVGYGIVAALPIYAIEALRGRRRKNRFWPW